MFAWLSSTYRVPPKQEEDAQTDDDLLAGGQDLPTAMKYRFLKNTAKDHVGVYRFAEDLVIELSKSIIYEKNKHSVIIRLMCTHVSMILHSQSSF